MRQRTNRFRSLTERTMLMPKDSAKRIAVASTAILILILACGPIAPTSEAPPLQPAETTEAPQVEQPPTNTPTPTTPPWIEGSVVRAPYDPAAGFGPPHVNDDFSGTNPEFELDNAAGVAHGWYQNGRYNITFPTRGWWTWYSGATTVTNFYVDVVVYNGDQCADRDAGGLLYRYIQSIDLGLMFGVTCGGGYFSGVTGGPGASGPVCQFISSSVNGLSDLDCSGLWQHPTSPYIDTGPGAANRIGIRATGTQMILYINGHQVDTLSLLWSLPVGEKFALYLGAGQADDASVSFDDLSIWFNP